MKYTSTRLVGLDEALERIHYEIRSFHKRVTQRGLLKAGLYIESMSLKQVPVVTGTLRSSQKTELFPARLGLTSFVRVGYYTAYAFRTHENPFAGRTQGFGPSGRPYPEGTWSKVGKWKFLQHPVQYNVPGILKIIVNEAKVR